MKEDLVLKNKNKFHKIITWSFYLVGLCMLILIVYIGCCQDDGKFQKRKLQGYEVVSNVKYREIEDDTVSPGIRKEYLLELGSTEDNNSCIAFYLVYHYAQVYVDDELVYSLMPGEKRTLSETAGCRWVLIPVYPEDEGKTMRVETFPVYGSVSGRRTEFLEGSRYAIFAATLKNDLPEIILSIFAILAGIAFTLIGAFCVLKKKSEDSLVYLGLFALCLGMWKAADTRFSALAFPDYTLVLSVLPLGMLILSVVNFILFIERQIDKKRWKYLNLVCASCVVVMMLQILLQITGVRDLRETLALTHLMIVATAVFVTQAVISEWRETKRNKKAGLTLLCFVLFAVGAAGDMIYYYVNGTSSGLRITIAIFVAYILTMGVMEILKLNHQANIDFSTGLFNRSRCNELINNNAIVEEGTCLIMFDLNQLKEVNDTLGHQAGDELIYSFADVLKKNIPASAFIGRYGGDEFLAVIKESSRDEILKIMQGISDAADNYHLADSPRKLSYAAGYVFSSDYPGLTMLQLLRKADYEMYLDKKKYYDMLNAEVKAQYSKNE